MKSIKSDNLEVKLQLLSNSESQQMWSVVNQKITTPVVPEKRFWLIFVAKSMYAPALVAALVFTASVGTITLAQQAEPGDVLYSVERAYEGLRLAAAITPEHKAELAIKFSQKRIKEVTTVLTKDYSEFPATQLVGATTTTTVFVDQAESTTTASISEPASTHSNIKSSKSFRPIKNLEKNHQALIGALNYLERTKAQLSKSGDTRRAETVDSLVTQLSEQTQGYISNLERIKQLDSSDKKTKDHIDRSEQELRSKFKLKSPDSDTEENQQIPESSIEESPHRN